MPKRIAQSPAGGLRRIRAADVGAHPDLEDHTLLRHRLPSADHSGAKYQGGSDVTSDFARRSLLGHSEPSDH
jgi:hypothetical protein